MGNPSTQDILAILRMNLVKDCPVTVQDVKLAEKIFGPDIGTIKGKTTRRKPLPVSPSLIEIPRELISKQKAVVLAIDDMKVNGLYFLTTISLKIYYWTAHCLPTTSTRHHL